MAVVQKLVVRPDVGGFTHDSFDHLMHLQVHMPGLDPSWDHTMVDARVTADGSVAELTIHSQPQAGLSLDRSLRIVSWTPAAHIRAHDKHGTVLCETRMDAPLQPGQVVELDGRTWRVANATDDQLWPHRNEHGVCRGDIDWQHVTLLPEDTPAHLPRLRREGT